MWPYRQKVDPIAAFWGWFVAHVHELAAGEANEIVVRTFESRLRTIHRGLVFDVDRTTDPPSFVVSADDDVRLFPTVIDTVRRAPKVPGWSIVAFRQPGPLDQMVRMGPYEIGAEDVWFRVEAEREMLTLWLFVRGCDDTNFEIFQRACLVLLNAAVGEYALHMVVGTFHLAALPDDPATRGLLPFSEIRRALGASVKVPIH